MVSPPPLGGECDRSVGNLGEHRGEPSGPRSARGRDCSTSPIIALRADVPVYLSMDVSTRPCRTLRLGPSMCVVGRDSAFASLRTPPPSSDTPGGAKITSSQSVSQSDPGLDSEDEPNRPLLHTTLTGIIIIKKRGSFVFSLFCKPPWLSYCRLACSWVSAASQVAKGRRRRWVALEKCFR